MTPFVYNASAHYKTKTGKFVDMTRRITISTDYPHVWSVKSTQILPVHK